MNLSLNFKNIKENIITLNLLLMIIGYQFVTCLLMPLVGEASSRILTIPYRAFALGISLLSIGIGIQNWQKAPRINTLTLLVFVYIALYGLRIIYDNANGIYSMLPTSRINLFYFVIFIPYTVSMLLTYESINYRKLLIYLCILGNIAIILSFVFAKADLSENARMNGNAALNTISYGHLGVSVFIITLFVIKQFNLNKFIKLLLWMFVLLDLYTSLRAGSRGPMVTLMILGFFWLAAVYKNLFIAIFPTVIVFALVILFSEQILDIIHSISPVAANRFNDLLAGNSSGRDSTYTEVLLAVSESPIIGIGYLFNGFYPHNIILDGLIAFGVLGGFVFTYILYAITMLCYKSLVFKHQLSWIALLTIQDITGSMFSGATWSATKLFGLFIICIMIFSNIRENRFFHNPNMLPRPMPPLMPRQNFRRINPHR